MDSEDEQLRESALETATAIVRARQRAERELLAVQQELRSSAQHLQIALAAGRLGDFQWDARQGTLTLSDRAAKILRVEGGGPLSGHELEQQIHPDDRERVRTAFDSAHADPEGYHVEFRLSPTTGPAAWVVAHGRRADHDGELSGSSGVLQDITDRVLAAQALEDETRVLELLNETGAAIASQLDLEGLVQTVTDAATEISGAKFGAFFYNVANERGESFLLFSLSGAPREAFERFGLPRNTPVFEPTFRGVGIVRSDDITKDPRYGTMSPHHGMPKGHLPVVSYLAVPVVSRSGEVIGGLFFGHPDAGVFTARSERIVTGIAAQAAVAIDNARLYEQAQSAAKDRQSSLEREQAARAEAERASNLKDDFLATLSHELRTPLSAILGWSQVLRRRPPTAEDIERGLEAIERNARMQTQLIEDLLDMSRITAGKLRLDVQIVDPIAFIEAAVQTVQPAADAREIRIEKMLDPVAGPVSGDPSRLQQVIANLLSNAIKFTPKGGKIQIVLARVNSHVEVSVADTGVGIEPALLDQVFERFRQADGSTTRRFGGLGLGLSIVKHLVELHGGSVRAESEGLEKGTTMTVLLPLAVVRRVPAIVERVHPTVAAPMLAEGDYRVADLSGVRVLVVDDDSDTRDLVQRVLRHCGATVAVASEAHEALDHVRGGETDLVVSDIGMPGLDGYELLRRVRALSVPVCNVPVIALTAFARSEDRTRALRAGFRMHLSKPVEPEELIATVASVAGRS
jgi:signal transduction histidine kinase/PAS domain-containing protein